MKKIFITYGDRRFRKARERIGREARKLGFFDEVIVYSPEDLPQQITSSPLMEYKRGGGYWCWKPYIIWATLQKFGDDAVVFYADAGCELQKSPDWDKYFDLVTQDGVETLVTQYDVSRRSQIMGVDNITLSSRHWTKLSVLEAFKDNFESDDWMDEGQTPSGFIVARGVNNRVITEWYGYVLSSPEYYIDSVEGEQNHSEFVEHRHDQSLLTILALMDRGQGTVIIPQKIEHYYRKENPAICVSRLSDYIVKQKRLKNRIKRFIKEIFSKKIK